MFVSNAGVFWLNAQMDRAGLRCEQRTATQYGEGSRSAIDRETSAGGGVSDLENFLALTTPWMNILAWPEFFSFCFALVNPTGTDKSF